MSTLKPYWPACLLAIASLVWYFYSTHPLIAQYQLAASECAALERGITEWNWVAKASLPVTPQSKRGSTTLATLEQRVRACNATLLRLNDGGNAETRLELRSDYRGLLRFLGFAATMNCNIKDIRRDPDGTLISTFSWAGASWNG